MNLDVAYKDQNFVRTKQLHMSALLIETRYIHIYIYNLTYFEEIVNTRVLKIFQRHVVVG